MMQKMFLVCLMLSVAPFSSARAGGNEVGDGTDYPSAISSTAWFVTDKKNSQKKFRYCYVSSADFGADSEMIEKSIAKALSVWNQYIQEKNANVTYGNRQIVYQGVLQSECDGSEDLKFYFGIENPEIKNEKLKYNQPTAFTLRTSYDVDKTWGKGLLWVTHQGSLNPAQPFPDWSQKDVLTGILIHEIGHLLGCQHVPGTIMDVDLAGHLSAGTFPSANLLKIDYKRELVLSPKPRDYKGRFGDQDAKNFEIFFGRPPQGQIQAQYAPQESQEFLWVSDSVETARFPLKLTSLQVPIESSQKLFKIAYRKNREIVSESTPVKSYIETGKILTRTGRSFEFSKEVNIEKNTYEDFADENCGPLNLRYKVEDEMKTLFRSLPL